MAELTCLGCSRLLGMKTTVLIPARAPAAATALARLPVDGAGEDLGVELAGGAQGAGDDAVLERVGGVGRVVLDPQVVDAELAAEVVGLEQPGEAGLHVGALLDVVGHRQQRLVAPDVGRARGDLLAGDGREVVGHLERPEALRTRVVRAERDLVAALAAGQGAGIAEGTLAQAVVGVAVVFCHSRVLMKSSFSSVPGDSRCGSDLAPAPATADVIADRRLAGGCRDFVGPFPQSLVMSRLSLGRPSHDVHIESTMWHGRRLSGRVGRSARQQLHDAVRARRRPRRRAAPGRDCSVGGRAHHEPGQALGAQRSGRPRTPRRRRGRRRRR